MKKPIMRKRNCPLGQKSLDTIHIWRPRWSSPPLGGGNEPLFFEAVMRCWMKANESLSEVTGETHKLPTSPSAVVGFGSEGMPPTASLTWLRDLPPTPTPHPDLHRWIHSAMTITDAKRPFLQCTAKPSTYQLLPAVLAYITVPSYSDDKMIQRQNKKLSLEDC